jgi:CheY-like chemotaxis protein/HPt (histidine-containing phosphotransfer) domain-containing protein
VLLAEDEPVSRKATVRLLESWGIRAHTVGTGREALHALEQSAYDVVLMDVEMPDMDGFEATAELRLREAGTGAHTPIIAITAHASQGDRRRCLVVGMDDFISKPVNADHLRAALSRWVGAAWIAPEPASPAVAAPDTEADPITPSRFPGARAGVIDFEQLSDSACGSQEFERELVNDFTSCSTQRLAELRAALAERQPGDIEHAAHALKGASRTMGAVRMGDTAARIEVMAAEGQVQLGELIEQLAREFSEARETLEEHLRHRAA